MLSLATRAEEQATAHIARQCLIPTRLIAPDVTISPTRMKRCPNCRRDYFDDSLTFCLDDGTRLLEGPAADVTPTEIMPSHDAATLAFKEPVTTAEIQPGVKKSRALLAITIAVILVVGLGWMGYTYYDNNRAHQIGSIAVMPFENIGGNPDIEYLSDGITESLINSLSQMPTLAVKARSSVFAYKGKIATPQQLAKELSVEAVLNGRVVQRGDQVVLNVELVDAATGNQIWGDQYSRKVTDLIQLQNEIARDVSGKLRSKLGGGGQMPKNYTENTEAYQLYLRGRYHWNKRTPADLKKSIDYFQQAIDKDPTYALAYGAMAEGYILIPGFGIGTQDEYYAKARAAAMKAIEIDDSLAEAHNAIAAVLKGHDWKFPEAEAEWRKAIEINPNYASAHQWYGEFLSSMGRDREALAEMRRAQELDPLSLIINGMLAMALSNCGMHEEALEQLRKTSEMDPNFPRTHLYYAEVFQRMGRLDEAADELAKLFVLAGGSPEESAHLVAGIKNSARTGGEKAYSRAKAEMMESHTPKVRPPAAVIAANWARAGELDKAFGILERAFREHDDSLLMLKAPMMDPLKGDPRYKDLLRRIGLPE